MADALASGASVLRDVGVQVPLRPPAERVYGLSGAKVTKLFGLTSVLHVLLTHTEPVPNPTKTAAERVN